MSIALFVDRHSAEVIRQVLIDVRNAIEALDLDANDRADLQAVVDNILIELDMKRPKAATLAPCLNSLARSLRFEPQAQTVVMELDAAMSEAQLPRTWEH